jgi:flagellar hook assembly protein FlgD
VNAAKYLDSVVTMGTTYYYKVGAIDKAGNEGPVSDQFSLKATSVEQFTGMPTTFSLDQNYPNPFNPSTQIRFALPSQAKVVLNIYSVSGELVRTLVNTDMGAGFYAVTWNGMNDNGQSVSTGVYLFRVQAGSFVSSKKMLLVK